MDFGIGFLSNNIMLPILDFFYGLVPSYGFAIIALTIVIRLAVVPLSAGQIRHLPILLMISMFKYYLKNK